jgi:hypothetical protein
VKQVSRHVQTVWVEQKVRYHLSMHDSPKAPASPAVPVG